MQSARRKVQASFFFALPSPSRVRLPRLRAAIERRAERQFVGFSLFC